MILFIPNYGRIILEPISEFCDTIKGELVGFTVHIKCITATEYKCDLYWDNDSVHDYGCTPTEAISNALNQLEGGL